MVHIIHLWFELNTISQNPEHTSNKIVIPRPNHHSIFIAPSVHVAVALSTCVAPSSTAHYRTAPIHLLSLGVKCKRSCDLKKINANVDTTVLFSKKMHTYMHGDLTNINANVLANKTNMNARVAT